MARFLEIQCGYDLEMQCDFDFRFRTQIEYPILDFRFFDFSNSDLHFISATRFPFPISYFDFSYFEFRFYDFCFS